MAGPGPSQKVTLHTAKQNWAATQARNPDTAVIYDGQQRAVLNPKLKRCTVKEEKRKVYEQCGAISLFKVVSCTSNSTPNQQKTYSTTDLYPSWGTSDETNWRKQQERDYGHPAYEGMSR